MSLLDYESNALRNCETNESMLSKGGVTSRSLPKIDAMLNYINLF